MESRCFRYTELPQNTKLFTDFVYQFERVAEFYSYPPLESSSYEAAAAEVRYPEERRRALVELLRKQNGDSESLDLLVRPGTTVVVAGQQVGLFSGPVYTIYKALSAARLARDLTDRGIPAVPVFWLATEDHDFAEINHCWTFDGSHRPVRLEVSGDRSVPRPVGRIAIESSPADELRRSLQSFPFGEEAAALAAEAYAPGRTFGTAFSDLLRRLLPSYGLLHLDPLHPSAREMAAPMLREAVEAAPELVRLLLDRSQALEAAGYHAQVHVEPQSSLVFLLEDERRLPLRRQDGDYLSGKRRFSPADLAARAAELSPNVLLRPVVQDYLLPTAAYVAGPAELAYLAQAQVLYRSLLRRMPAVVHRAGFTLLDQRAEKLMLRYGLSFADFFRGEEALRERISRGLVPPALERRLEETRRSTAGEIERLRQELLSFDPTLAAALDKSGAKILYQISKIERKVSRESFRRDERATEEASYLYGLIYPRKHLQERFYSILPFVAKHGFDLIGRIYENIRLDCPDHQMLVA